MNKTVDIRLAAVCAGLLLALLLAYCVRGASHTSAVSAWQSDTTAWKGGWR